MYKRITIIGLGTLGGFLANSISSIEEVEQLTLIDYDYVEKRNLKNQIYDLKDVSCLKVDALFKKLKSKRPDLKLRRVKEKYYEDVTKIPSTDLTIDCRDFTYDRGNKIDVRVYISSRYMIVDCRRDVKFEKHHEGKYLSELKKHDLDHASHSFSNLIITGALRDLIKNRVIHKIYLDQLQEDSNKTIQKSEDSEMIIDSHNGDKKLSNIYEVSNILKSNKKYDTVICLGDHKKSLIEKEFPKNSFDDINSLITTMLSLISQTKNITVYQNYVISPKIINNRCYVQLLPETGAA